MAKEPRQNLMLENPTAGLICFEDFEAKCLHVQSESGYLCSHLKKLKTILQLKMLNVNARYESGNTMLHFAAKNADSWAIKLLLSNGADSNIRSDSGETPMFLIFSSKASNERKRECVESLILHGAEYDKVNYEGDTVVNAALKNGSFFSLQPVIAHVAWLRELGLPVDEAVFHQIKFVRVLNQYYQSCIGHLREMKFKKIDEENVTEYQVLTEDKEIIATYLRNPVVVKKFQKHKVCSDFFYDSLFKIHIRKAMEIKRLRLNASIVFRKCIKLFENSSHIIVDRIISHLSNADLYMLKHIVEEEENKLKKAANIFR